MIGTLLADKDRELGDTRSEIKALKYSDRLKGKAVEEVRLNPSSVAKAIAFYLHIASL